MTVAYGKGPKGKATRLHAKIVRSRGHCQRCGESDPTTLQAAHIVSRRYSNTRTLLENAWCLCAKCHFVTGDEPDEFLALVDRTIGREQFYSLKRTARSTKKVDWVAEAARLDAIDKAQLEPVTPIRRRPVSHPSTPKNAA